MISRNLVPYRRKLAGRRLPKGKRKIKSVCRMDHGGCGVIATVEDGRISSIVGDKDNLDSEGYQCVKGRAAIERVYHPDRLKYPMKRVGEHGSRVWEPISWNEAFDIVASRLSQLRRDYGAESLVFASGTERGFLHIMWRFCNAFGTPNGITTSHICFQPKARVAAALFGRWPEADFNGNPQCIVLWGNNPPFTNSDQMCGGKFLRAWRREGVKRIVIDPRRINLAAQAELWLQLRPGTDAALAMGMLHVIIEEKLYENDFVAKWTTGFPELAERVKEYTPERVSEITWVPANTIIEAARMFASTKPACIQLGVAVEQCENVAGNLLAIYSLAAITGNLDVPGGMMFWTKAGNYKWPVMDPNYTLRRLLDKQQIKKCIGGDKYPIYCGIDFGATVRAAPPLVWKAISTGKPYPIKGLIICGHNPLVSGDNTQYIRKAFDKLEFIVVIDLFNTPTTDFADIILPAASWLEIDDIVRGGYYLFARRKIVSMWQCKSDFEILNELGKRLGHEEYFWSGTEDNLDSLLQSSGMTWQDFKKKDYFTGGVRYRKYEKRGFATPSGKVELYSSIFKKYGYDPLPSFTEPHEGFGNEQYAKEYPLLATTARLPFFMHTENREAGSLRRAHPEPLVEIHPETANKYGIHQGEEVCIESKVGKIAQKAKLNSGIDPRVIYIEHGWWFPESDGPGFDWDRSGINVLTDNNPPFDPVFCSTRLRPIRCKIYPKTSS